MPSTLDTRDSSRVAELIQALDQDTNSRVGDYVRFADGTMQRISHRWPEGVQTSTGGRFHLGRFGCSFSGSLNPVVPYSSLRLTDEKRDGWVWIFHHDFPRAGGGVDFKIPFRVYECTI